MGYLDEEYKKRYEKLYEIMYSSTKVSDLSVTDLCRIIREIVRDEIGRNLPIHQISKYEGSKIPNTPGELNDNSGFHTTNHTVFESDKFPGWGHGYQIRRN